MKKVKLYVTIACPYCHTLKEFLKEHNVVFEEIDVGQDEKARDYIIEKTGKMEVPIMEIDDEVVIGFDRAKITNLLNIEN